MTHVIHRPEVNQINFLDQRFYTNDGGKTFFPSVTTILEIYPKGFGFDQWLKDVGNNASQIADRAAEIGSKVHALTEQLNMGIQLTWADENGNALHSKQEWEMILRYADFWKKCSPKLIANEKSFCSPDLGFGGTIDRVVMIGGKRYMIDIKTSNYLHTSHELQLSAYATMWNEFNPHNPIEETAILWLKPSIRTENIDLEKGIYQGISDAGAWQLKTFKRHYSDAYKIFQHTHAIWKEENPTYKPANKVLPDVIMLDSDNLEAEEQPIDYQDKISKINELKQKAGI